MPAWPASWKDGSQGLAERHFDDRSHVNKNDWWSPRVEVPLKRCVFFRYCHSPTYRKDRLQLAAGQLGDFVKLVDSMDVSLSCSRTKINEVSTCEYQSSISTANPGLFSRGVRFYCWLPMSKLVVCHRNFELWDAHGTRQGCILRGETEREPRHAEEMGVP